MINKTCKISKLMYNISHIAIVTKNFKTKEFLEKLINNVYIDNSLLKISYYDISNRKVIYGKYIYYCSYFRSG